jgi:F420-dependent oxidoreductase-like protein
MRLAVTIGFSERHPLRMIETARLAESLGFHSVWTGEAYGADAVVPLAAVATHTERIHLGTGILQMPARTPAMTAMTAATLDALSGGRVLLGLGLSGPQVVEGWHGRPYTPPLQTTREYVAAVRALLARERFELHGDVIDVPYHGDDTTGLGKALKLGLHPRADIPIYLAAIGPRNIRLATEIADGILPIFWSPTGWKDAFGDVLADVDLHRFDIVATVPVVLGDDVTTCRERVRPFLATYVGGMGARGRNFYFDLACRLGHDQAATTVQDLYLRGDKAGAAAAVSDALVDDVALVGPPARILERLESWKSSPVSTMNLVFASPQAMELLASNAA